ncbi:MAG: DUF2807 domain-containing protein [Candidatus Chryseobacterium colombiense]|nr:DUF2807 domain-containing protein [Chryseobacterium sp.]WEK71629.1 MAG: DUF2807 domain-containing protein [Chryseobacterium sp.]
MIKSELCLNDNVFSEINLKNFGKVFLSKGKVNSIIIERNSDNGKHIDFKIVDGVAFINSVHATEESKKDNYNIYLTVKNENISINALNLGSFETEHKTDFKTIKLKIINCGQINLLVASQSLSFNLQNVFSLKIGGQTDTLTLQKNNIMFSNLRKLKVKSN